MFEEAYKKIDSGQVPALLRDISPYLEGVKFTPANTTIMAQSLTFYPGYHFYDISDHSQLPPVRRYVVAKEADVTVLDGSNRALYTLNKKAPIRLTDGNIGVYARFFFQFVRGAQGRFLLVESVDDIQWKEDPPIAGRKAIAQLISPLQLLDAANDGSFTLLARMIFKDSLFKSKIHIDKQGFVSFSGEELLVEDIPVIDDIFGL